MKKFDYKKQYYILWDYLEKNYNIGIKQQPNVDDSWYPFLNLIMINSNLKYRERFFTLLHESGHAIIDNDVRVRNATCFNKNSPDTIRSKRSYVHNLNEEILAWNYGKNIASNLNLEYDTDKLEKYMTDCIMSYIKSGLNSVYGKTIDINVIKIHYV